MFGVSRYGLCRYDERFITDDGRFLSCCRRRFALIKPQVKESIAAALAEHEKAWARS